MARGGARVNSGPPPDPEALRRDRKEDKAGWRILPADGRDGPTPEFPLPSDVHLTSALEVAAREREMLEAQIDSGDAPRGAHARLAKLDQKAAELQARLAASARMEHELWGSLWSTPQAVAWEALRWTREVALYARLQVLAELGDMEAGKEARQWSDRLGLNPASLARLRWKIEAVAPEAATPTKRKTTTRAKTRLKVVQGGKGGK